MKVTGPILLALLLLTAVNAEANRLSKTQRWMMRFLGVGMVGVGFVARIQESDNIDKAEGVMRDFEASHPDKQSPGYLREQFSAVSHRTTLERRAGAWSIGKNASWGLAGLLFTMSFIPDTWARPVESGQGVIVGYELRVGDPSPR